MKIKTIFFGVVFLLWGIFIPSVLSAQTQPTGTDAGLIVTEDSLLSAGHKQLVYVVAKDIIGPTQVKLSTYNIDGVTNNFTPMIFPIGLRRGQIIPLWNGQLNAFNNTPWLGFWVHILAPNQVSYYTHTMFPVGAWEQYKEPMITSITETGGYNAHYEILIRGIFDTTIPSMILLNTDVFVSPKTVTQTAPGMIKIDFEQNINFRLPPGKYLLTLCQAGHCDTLQGRHR